jgi:hypothetical protein
MRIMGIVALCVALGGCASVARGTTEQISISSTPPGVNAEVTGLENPTVCVTPCVVQVKRSADVTISFQKDGFEPQVIALTKDVAGTGAAGFAGNVLVGGLIGMGVDATTGAAMDHHPNPVIVTLQPTAPTLPPRAARPRPKQPPRPTAGT